MIISIIDNVIWSWGLCRWKGAGRLGFKPQKKPGDGQGSGLFELEARVLVCLTQNSESKLKFEFEIRREINFCYLLQSLLVVIVCYHQYHYWFFLSVINYY